MKFFSFPGDVPDLGPARVRSRRDMICRPLGCSPRPVCIGEEFTISDAAMRELGSDDIEFLGRVPIEVDFTI